MARRKQPAQWEVSMERNEKTYRAHYYVENGVVTIEVIFGEDAAFRRKSTQVGASAEWTARMLLREMIDAGRV